MLWRLWHHWAVPGLLYDFFSLMDTCPHGVNLMLIYAYLLMFFYFFKYMLLLLFHSDATSDVD